MDFVKMFENLGNVCVCVYTILSFENHQNQIITKINFQKQCLLSIFRVFTDNILLL